MMTLVDWSRIQKKVRQLGGLCALTVHALGDLFVSLMVRREGSCHGHVDKVTPLIHELLVKDVFYALLMGNAELPGERSRS